MIKVAPADQTEASIRQKLGAVYTEMEIDAAWDIITDIVRLKKEKNAVILGHNYMTPDVFHGVSDYVGDSLGLARSVSHVDADIILFNGVHFMAETAKIMSPKKKVLIADLEAGCSLAESITAADVRAMKEKHPGVPVVTYVNCSAEVKAETDICCTSANALKVIEAVDSDRIIFLPDLYLGQNMQKQTSKELILWEGKCMVHELYTADDIKNAKKLFDNLTVISHPECPPEVLDHSDFAGSTSQMHSFIEKSGADNILLLTECSMGDNMRNDFPNKHFVSTCQTCPHMKKITLAKVRDALIEEKFEVTLSQDIIDRARASVERMVEIG